MLQTITAAGGTGSRERDGQKQQQNRSGRHNDRIRPRRPGRRKHGAVGIDLLNGGPAAGSLKDPRPASLFSDDSRSGMKDGRRDVHRPSSASTSADIVRVNGPGADMFRANLRRHARGQRISPVEE